MEGAICDLLHSIYRSLDDKQSMLCILIDLTKAFDAVFHERLLEKLSVRTERKNKRSIPIFSEKSRGPEIGSKDHLK